MPFGSPESLLTRCDLMTNTSRRSFLALLHAALLVSTPEESVTSINSPSSAKASLTHCNLYVYQLELCFPEVRQNLDPIYTGLVTTVQVLY